MNADPFDLDVRFQPSSNSQVVYRMTEETYSAMCTEKAEDCGTTGYPCDVGGGTGGFLSRIDCLEVVESPPRL